MGDKMKKEITDETCKLYIGGINSSWSGERVKEILEAQSSCKVMRVDVVKNFAFAFVENKDIGEKVIDKVHGKVIEDCKIVIQISKNKQNLPDSEDLCFECGKAGHWAKECAKRRARLASRRGGYEQQGGHGAPPSRRNDRYYPTERGYPPPSEHRERDPYPRTYSADPYASRDYYASDPYYRDAYAYPATSRYSYDYGRYETTDSYNPRSVSSRDAIYASDRDRLGYGRSSYPDSSVARSYEPASTSAVVKAPVPVERDPYAAVSRRPVADPYEPVPRQAVQYAAPTSRSVYPASSYPASSYPASSYAMYSAAPLPPARSADPYERTDRYASDPAPKRFPEPAYAPRPK